MGSAGFGTPVWIRLLVPVVFRFQPKEPCFDPHRGASEYTMPIDALVIGVMTLIAAVSHFIWWDTQESKKPADGCNRQQATRENQPTTK